MIHIAMPMLPIKSLEPWPYYANLSLKAISSGRKYKLDSIQSFHSSGMNSKLAIYTTKVLNIIAFPGTFSPSIRGI